MQVSIKEFFMIKGALVAVLMVLVMMVPVMAQEASTEDQREEEALDPLQLIRKTQEDLLKEVWKYVGERYQQARTRVQPEWNEEEGDEGNMEYDQAVAQNELENEDLFRYMDLMQQANSSDPLILAQNISAISRFLNELKDKAQASCEPAKVIGDDTDILDWSWADDVEKIFKSGPQK